MFHLNEYKNRFRIPVSEWNKLARFINNLAGGKGIKIRKPDDPSASVPPVIGLEDGDEEESEALTEDVFFVSGWDLTQGDKVTLYFSKMEVKDGLIRKVTPNTPGAEGYDAVYAPVELIAY